MTFTDVEPLSYAFDRFTFEPSARALCREGVALHASSRALDILRLLIEHRDRTVTKDEILTAVWCGAVVEENNLAVQISGLRRLLGEHRGEQRFIATVSGRGYRFIAPLKQTPAPPAPLPPALPLPLPPSTTAIVPIAPRPWRAALVLLALLATLPITIGVLHYTRHGGNAPRLSIVVLPFRNLNPDDAQDYIADALCDDLTSDLSHLPGSVVIARRSADTYKDRVATASLIGHQLNVRYLLEGSIRSDGDIVHINAQLIDAPSGAHLWASSFTASRAGLGVARNDIVRTLASALNFTLVQIEAARSLHERPDNPDAVDLYLRARSRLDRDSSLPGLLAAQHMLEQAVAAAPEFSDARASLGLVLLRKIGNYDDPDEWRDHAEAARTITAAIGQAPRDPLVIAAHGMLAWEDESCDQAMPDFRVALALDPDEVQARDGLAQCARELGLSQQMIDGLRDMLRVDPAAPGNMVRQNLIGLGELMLGRPREALVWLNRARAAADPEADATALGWREWNSLYLIVAHWQNGEFATAATLYADYRNRWPRRTVWRMTAYETRAFAALQTYPAYVAALRAVGMPDSLPEDLPPASPSGSAPDPGPGGDFDPTPLSIAGARRITTASLHELLQRTPTPLVLDVGSGMTTIPGATLVWPRGTWGDQDRMLHDAAAPVARDAPDRTVVVMGDGPLGATSYDATLQLVAAGIRHVVWYRGGEQAWSASGYPSEDRRPQ